MVNPYFPTGFEHKKRPSSLKNIRNESHKEASQSYLSSDGHLQDLALTLARFAETSQGLSLRLS